LFVVKETEQVDTLFNYFLLESEMKAAMCKNFLCCDFQIWKTETPMICQPEIQNVNKAMFSGYIRHDF
jgi:hypothetical protein